MSPLEMVGLGCMIAGAVVFLIGSVGLIRLRDFYARLSGVTIAGALGTAPAIMHPSPTISNGLIAYLR